MKKITAVLATFNEENNIRECLELVREIADEIIIIDGSSTDKTVEIAEKFGAKVTVTSNPPIFHINKQKALDQASSEWILQLDADERVSKELSQEIIKVINMSDSELEEYQNKLPGKKLFARHQSLVAERDGEAGSKSGTYNAFFIPRLNYFLGKYLKHGGVYPDGVIRLIKKGKARFPCKDVHEQIEVEGKVGWLQNDLIHMADPTFKRYLERNSRYINLVVSELKQGRNKNILCFIDYLFVQPISWFLMTQIRHKGILDGFQGVVFSFFSALRFPRAYIRYLFQK